MGLVLVTLEATTSLFWQCDECKELIRDGGFMLAWNDDGSKIKTFCSCECYRVFRSIEENCDEFSHDHHLLKCMDDFMWNFTHGIDGKENINPNMRRMREAWGLKFVPVLSE